MSKGAPVVVRETLAWLDTHLRGRPAPPRSPVRVEVTNHGWIDLPDWAPNMTEQVLYLQPAHRLSDSPADATATPSTRTSDRTNSITARVAATFTGFVEPTATNRINRSAAERVSDCTMESCEIT